MTWTKLEPINNAGKRPAATAKVDVDRFGVVVVTLALNKLFVDGLGAARKLEILAGEGEHEGCLQLSFGEGGFTMIDGGRGTARLKVAAPPWAPRRERPSHPCLVMSNDGATVVLRLPLDKWTHDAPPAAAAPPPAVAPPAPPAELIGGEPLDAVEYLKGKGVDAKRVSGGRTTIDGEIRPPAAVLRMVNAWRQEARLGPLELHQIK